MPSANNSKMFNGNVPLIDFSKYTEGPWSEKTRCRDLLTHCLATYGFARLINCGVKDSNVDKAFNLVRYYVPLHCNKGCENPQKKELTGVRD
jgi:isopenicillin N synthase-like dioxygenase